MCAGVFLHTGTYIIRLRFYVWIFRKFFYSSQKSLHKTNQWKNHSTWHILKHNLAKPQILSLTKKKTTCYKKNTPISGILKILKHKYDTWKHLYHINCLYCIKQTKNVYFSPLFILKYFIFYHIIANIYAQNTHTHCRTYYLSGSTYGLDYENRKKAKRKM